MGTRWNQTKMIFATRQMIIQIISAAIIMYPCCQCKLLNLPIFPISFLKWLSLFEYDIHYGDIFFIGAKMEMNIRQTVVRVILRINYLKGHVVNTPTQELSTFV